MTGLWRRSVPAVIVALVVAACGADGAPAEIPGSGGGDLNEAKAVLERQELPDFVTVPDIGEVRTRGTVGEGPAWYTDLELTDEQLEQVRGEGLTAAFLNWDDSSYNQAILAGARDALAAMNIELVATSNYSFDSTRLAASALNIAALQPDIVFYSGLDPVSDIEALKPLTDQGASVVSYANAPGEWTTDTPSNFVTLVSYDTHAIGAVVADAIHDRFPDGANVGIIYFDATYKLVNEREGGFEDQLATYDNLEVLTREPMTDPFATEQIANAMITRHPDLDVIFAPWDLPAEGVKAAVQGAGRADDIAIATIDLGFTGVRDMACGGPIFVESSQLVYEWGRTGAIAAALHAIDGEVPPYVIVPVFAVTSENLEEGWELAYQGKVPLPPEVADCLD